MKLTVTPPANTPIEEIHAGHVVAKVSAMVTAKGEGSCTEIDVRKIADGAVEVSLTPSPYAAVAAIIAHLREGGFSVVQNMAVDA